MRKSAIRRGRRPSMSRKAQSEIASIAAANVLNNADFVKRPVKGVLCRFLFLP